MMSKANLSICVMIATLVAVMTLFFLPVPASQTVEVTTVMPGVLQMTYMLEGEAVQGDQQMVVAPVGGFVEQIYVKSGDSVQAGQLLVRLDARSEAMALSQLDERIYQMNSNLSQLLFRQEVEVANMDLLMNAQQQRETLVAAIACKQIRATADGTVENLYVTEGSYLGAASVIGSLYGEEQKVTAYWMAQDGQTPVPGMIAWWCAVDGTQQEALILESVGAPITQNETIVYPLMFRSTMGEQTAISKGEKAPICLVLQEKTVAAMVPIEAMDQNEQLWVLQNGRATPVKAEWKQHNETHLQIQEELLGAQVILKPDQLDLCDGMALRTSEGL